MVEHGWFRPRRPQGQVIFQIDREGPVPPFYVLTVPQESKLLGEPGQHVLAPSGQHPKKAWLMLGVVSVQSPFGQGMAMGVKKSEVVKATPADIRRALQRDHPFGDVLFVPGHLTPDQMVLRQWDRVTHRQIAAILRTLR